MSSVPSPSIILSITGLKLKGFWRYPHFMSLAVPAMIQAQNAPGNLGAETRTMGGVHHTRTLWRDRDCMLAYVRSGAHLKAMRAFPTMASGLTWSQDTSADTVPDWPEIHSEWTRRYAAGERTGMAAPTT